MMAIEQMSSALGGAADGRAMVDHHPSSPVNAAGGGMVPAGGPDGSPPSPPPDHRRHMPPDAETSMGYGRSYGGPPPPGYPPSYSGYGGPPPPHSPYASHHGYPPRGPPPGPPHGYPPSHHSPSYPYGYPPPGPPPRGPPPPYHYASYESPYPGGPPPRPGYGGPPPPGATQSRSAPPSTSPTKSSPPGPSSSPRASPVTARPVKPTDHVEVEKLRAAAATELTHDEVKPIQSDFHFFLKDNLEKYKKLAEEEVRHSTNNLNGKLDPFLVNTNLNTRLMKAWEDLQPEEREVYKGKEEEDRQRFMEEDEIASRHCATLTARGKSPRTSLDKQTVPGEDGVKKEERQESETKPGASPGRESPKDPSRKPEDAPEEKKTDDKESLASVKKEEEKAAENGGEETVNIDKSTKKREATESPTEAGDVNDAKNSESPTKKSKNSET